MQAQSSYVLRRVILALLAALTLPVAVGVLHAPITRAQSKLSTVSETPAQAPASAPEWQTAAGGKMAFEVASVKQGPFVPPSFPLDAGDSFKQTGGYFTANFPLFQFVMFAYKINPGPEQRKTMVEGLPSWFTTTRFTVEAKAPNNPTKDQFRLMMQSLLAERFHLAIHYETQQAALYAVSLVIPGKLGPNLHAHTENPPCKPADWTVDGVPCGNVRLHRASQPGHVIQESRNIPMTLFANYLFNISMGALDRLVIDQTGLAGGFDFELEFSPEQTPFPDPGNPPDPQGPTFLEALHDQLGLKLESTRGPVQVLRIDHVELPSEN